MTRSVWERVTGRRQWEHRRRTRRCARKARTAADNRNGRDAGFFEQGSHRIIPPGDCPAAMRPVAAVLEPIRQAVKNGAGTGTATIEPVCGADGRCVVVVNQEHGAVSGLHETIMTLEGVHGVWSRSGRSAWLHDGDETIKWPAAGLPGQVEMMDVDPRGFTQAHQQINPLLIETVISHLGQSPQDLKIVEFYAGSGNITIPLGMRRATVLASDINALAIESSAAQCAERGLDIRHMSGDTESILNVLPAEFRQPDAVIADPPRTGLGKSAERIASMQAGTVVICSCEPSALARDIKPFVKAGYLVQRVTLVDMFPTTYHMETIISLTFNRLCGESRNRPVADGITGD